MLLNRFPLFLGPLHGERARLKRSRDEQLAVAEKLRLDAELAVIAQLARDRVIAPRNDQSGSTGRCTRGGVTRPGT